MSDDVTKEIFTRSATVCRALLHAPLHVLQYFAITAAWAGDKELALQQLEAGLRAPTASYMLSYGALKLLPFWDPLRGDPRFEKIVALIRNNSRSAFVRRAAIVHRLATARSPARIHG